MKPESSHYENDNPGSGQCTSEKIIQNSGLLYFRIGNSINCSIIFINSLIIKATCVKNDWIILLCTFGYYFCLFVSFFLEYSPLQEG